MASGVEMRGKEVSGRLAVWWRDLSMVHGLRRGTAGTVGANDLSAESDTAE